jgi:hypothetical protein
MAVRDGSGYPPFIEATGEWHAFLGEPDSPESYSLSSKRIPRMDS